MLSADAINVERVNSFPPDKTLDSTKFKTFADYKLNVT